MNIQDEKIGRLTIWTLSLSEAIEALEISLNYVNDTDKTNRVILHALIKSAILSFCKIYNNGDRAEGKACNNNKMQSERKMVEKYAFKNDFKDFEDFKKGLKILRDSYLAHDAGTKKIIFKTDRNIMLSIENSSLFYKTNTKEINKMINNFRKLKSGINTYCESQYNFSLDFNKHESALDQLRSVKSILNRAKHKKS